MKKSILYKIHRYLSIVCLIPVVLWCVSGLTHPIMANWFRIKPVHRTAPVVKIDTAKILLSAKQVAVNNDLDTFQNIGIKVLKQQPYYMFNVGGNEQFYNTTTGDLLKKGDLKYASFLASYYSGFKESTITGVNIVTEFSSDYKVINRHLPVYKVSFSDAGKSDVFVHIPSANLGTINNSLKRSYLWVFSNFHNWDFLGDNHTIKPFLVFTLSLSTFIVGVLGLVIYFVNRKKYKKRTKKVKKLKKRNLHRYLSVPVSIFFLMFSFSGAYHAFQKFEVYDLNQHEPINTYNVEVLTMDFLEVNSFDKLQRISLVKIQEEIFYRFSFLKNPIAKYYNANTLEELKDGDEKYAVARAVTISKKQEAQVSKINLITHFKNEYGFINKRLPVYGVSFNDAKGTKCYVETASGIPGALVDKNKKREALSFIMLHKFHFLDFLGKQIRDVIIALAVLSVLVVLFTGLRVFIQLVRKR